MLDDATPTKRQRKQSDEAVRYRAEHRAMLLFRKRIGELQSRMAFALARAGSGRVAAHGELESDFAVIKTSITALLEEIETTAPKSDIGPAENCRRALQVLSDRLEATAS